MAREFTVLAITLALVLGFTVAAWLAAQSQAR